MYSDVSTAQECMDSFLKLPSCHDFFLLLSVSLGQHFDLHQSEQFIISAQPITDQEVITCQSGCEFAGGRAFEQYLKF